MIFKESFQKFKSLVNKRPIWHGKTDYTIVPAFICGNTQYYEIPGVFNIPYKRGMAAGEIYEEVQMRVTREYLHASVSKGIEILSDPKTINVFEITKILKELDDRLNWIVSPETLYKLASVVYFDENENPDDYNYQYGIEKIKKWKKYKVEDFFLREPIGKYIPHSGLQDQDLVNYIHQAIKEESLQSENLLQGLSKVNQMKDFYKTLKSLQVDRLQS